MVQPKGYQVKGKEDDYCLLQKSIYGLKQSQSVSTKDLMTTELRLVFKEAPMTRVCTLITSHSRIIFYLSTYICGWYASSRKSKENLKYVKELLKAEFDMKDSEESERILCIEIGRQRDK